MTYTAIFQRVEKKYLLTQAQLERILPALLEFLIPDGYGETTVCSLYLDTPDDLLARRSIEKPAYKEKLRLRSYGVPGDESAAYLEMKKKTGGIVYKRRIACRTANAMAYLKGGAPPCGPCQIFQEIDYMRLRYGLSPRLCLCYDRTAYLEREPTPDALRVTIDRHVRVRESGLDLRLGDAGDPLLPENARLMEIKTARALPIWLCDVLARHRVYPAPFSKYGRAYQARTRRMAARETDRERETVVVPYFVQGGAFHAYNPD